ncbi:MAG: hypothetical protein KGI78_00130 [Patescibacteria group bacterium]|nr:hypothetical protein [Patescibacteria group bacterium]MDE1945442.1 hypothetical protein [Patescibacteria group bacterium]MDE2057245.1 hypothetical protein [Patescibacteria group bacterium]
MTDVSDIERVVMRRVQTIRFLRPFVSGGALAALVLALALWGIGREVWVAKVFSNGPHGFFAHARYLAYAFRHTRLVVQALVLASAAAAFILTRALLRPIAFAFAPAPSLA